MAPLATQTLGDDEEQRRRNLGNNGPRDLEGRVMTHCVPSERVAVADDLAEVTEQRSSEQLSRSGAGASRGIIGARVPAR